MVTPCVTRPLSVVTTAIFVPSGDQRGCSVPIPVRASSRAPEPSAFATMIAVSSVRGPEMVRVKASFVPSRETSAVPTSSSRRRGSPPTTGMRQSEARCAPGVSACM
jgi:hypothetical protein